MVTFEPPPCGRMVTFDPPPGGRIVTPELT
jgi:hypothetical protein